VTERRRGKRAAGNGIGKQGTQNECACTKKQSEYRVAQTPGLSKNKRSCRFRRGVKAKGEGGRIGRGDRGKAGGEEKVWKDPRKGGGVGGGDQ